MLLILKAKEEEEAVYKRCSNKKIYLNLAVNTVKRLRTETDSKVNGSKPKPGPMKTSHAAMLNGSSKISYTLHRSGGAVKLPDQDFLGESTYKSTFKMLLKFCLCSVFIFLLSDFYPIIE